MVPTRSLLHHDGKNSAKSSYCPAAGQCCVGIATRLEASAWQDHKPSTTRSRRLLAMADDGDQLAAAAPPRTSSQGGTSAGDDDGEWLQLGLGMGPSSSSASSSGDNNSSTGPAPSPTELDLFTNGYGKQHVRMMRPPPPLSPLPLRSYYSGHGRYWRPAAARGSVSAPFLPFSRPLRSSSDGMRVVSPPPRRTEAAGLWLILQAAPNQDREPILPQIPKSYLRIKDSNVKVEVVMKYLADKLELARSHQVELTCRGQLLPPFWLVKYVRDSIWCPSALREEEALALAGRPPARRSLTATTITTDHVMTLCYNISRNRTTNAPRVIIN